MALGAGCGADGDQPDAYRTLGDIMVARERLPWTPLLSLGSLSIRADVVALCLTEQPQMLWRQFDRNVESIPVDTLLVDLTEAATLGGKAGDTVLVIYWPRPLIFAILPERIDCRLITPSPALLALGQLARRLLTPVGALREDQAGLIAHAMTTLLQVSLSPALVGNGLAPMRGASLLARIVDHIDQHLAEDLDATVLCNALNTSRSALYRAAESVGGISALVQRRRLSAVHDQLREADDRRTIFEIARSCGFYDAPGFSRAYKRRYAVTAADHRQQYRTVNARGSDETANV